MATGAHAALAERLLRHGLMSDPQVKEFFGKGNLPPEPERVVDELVRRAYISAYQAVHLLSDELHLLELGGYRLLEPIGSGGMGEVFLARQLKFGRLVALKLIRPHFAAEANLIARFQREAKAVANLNHPNIVVLYDADEHNGTHFLSMEYVRGLDLSDLVAKHGPLPIAPACDYMRQAALGLQHAHEHNLIHRDIKPSNLLVAMSEGQGPMSPTGDYGLVKILDLGLARVNEDPTQAHLTRDRGLLGTPDYMSPEQGRDSSKVDGRSDLYSLGCTFYFLLTGQPPFPDGSGVEKVLCHQLERPKPVTQFRQDIPPEVVAIINRLMRKEPRERYQMPLELVTALAGINATRVAPPGVTKPTPLPPLVGPSPRPLEPFAPPVAGPNTPTLKMNVQPQAPSMWGLFEQTSFGKSEAGGESTPGSPPAAPSVPPVPTRASSLVGPSPRPTSLLPSRPLPPSRGTPPAERPTNGAAANSLGVVVRAGPAPVQLPRASSFCVPAQPFALLEGHTAPVSAMAFGPRGRLLATGGLDNAIRIWRINGENTAQITEFFDPRLGEIRAVAFAGTGDLLISSSGCGGRIWFWRWQDEHAQEMNALDGSFGAGVISVSADGQQVAAGEGTRIAIWTATGRALKPRGEFATRGGSVTALTHSYDGRVLIAGDAAGHVQTWRDRWRGFKPVAFFTAHNGSITKVRISPDDRRLVTAGTDNVVRLWTTRDDIKNVAQISGAVRGTVRRIQFSSAGTDFLTATDAGQVARWRSEDAGQIIEWRVNHPVSTAIAVADHGETIAMGRTDSAVQVYLLPPEPLNPTALRASAQALGRGA